MSYHCNNESHRQLDCTYCLATKKTIPLADIHSWVKCPPCTSIKKVDIHHCQNEEHRSKECNKCPETGNVSSYNCHNWVKCDLCSKIIQNEIDNFNSKSSESKNTEDNMTDMFMCKFCGIMLNHGYDNSEMLHCQGCHNVYDGFAQCPCWTD